MKSPIEQQIIDGAYYWDTIGPNWFRLLLAKPEKVDRGNVLGHVRMEYGHADTYYIAVRHLPYYLATGSADKGAFDSPEQARQWVEQGVVENWIGRVEVAQ